MSNAVGSCGCLVLVVLFLLLLLSENGGVQAKAIGKAANIELINESVTLSTVEVIKRTTTDDAPIFDRTNVALSVPDGLFAATANVTLRLRDLLGQLILRSAARLAQLMRFIQPLFGGHLVIEIPKELDNI